MSDNPSTTYPEKVRASHFSQTGFEMRQAIAPSTSSPDERVFSAIYDAVQGQRLVPGLKLKEMELANLFKVSRTSVRNALLRLAHKGLVDIAPNRGAIVAQLSPEDCRQLYEARRAIEGTIVEILAQRRTPAIVKSLRAHVTAQRRAFERSDTKEGYRLAIAFHRLLAELAGNRILAQVLDDLLSRMPLVILTIGSQRSANDATHADHIELVEAIAAGRAANARRILSRHLQHLEDDLNEQRPAAARSLAEMLAI
jgi:DNA-binding GntR family transcriptional regulator